MAGKTTVKAVLWLPRPQANGEFPIWIRITKDGTRKYVNTNLTSTPVDWDEKEGLPKKSHPHKKEYDLLIDRAIHDHKQKALRMVIDETPFTASTLAKSVAPKKKVAALPALVLVKNPTVLVCIKEEADGLKEEGKLEQAGVYRKLYNQLKLHNQEQDLEFSEITFDFLVGFEKYFAKRDLKDSYVSTYFRKLRKIYMDAIRKGYAFKNDYPFDDYKIEARFSAVTQKRAITKEQITLLGSSIVDKVTTMYEAQQLFMFSYYGMGMNFIDMAGLKWQDLHNNRIFYERSKTDKELTYSLGDQSRAIIEHFRPYTQAKGNIYIFPIYDQRVHITEAQKCHRRKKVLRRVNRDMKVLAEKIGLDTKITSYVARHTFATVLKDSGVSTAIISEAMGHASEAVTEIYLKKFGNPVIDEALKNLL